MRVPHHNSQTAQPLGLPQRRFGVFHLGNVGESDHRAFDDIFQGSIGADAHQEPRARFGLNFNVPRFQTVQHRPHIGHQMVIVHQVGDDVAHRAPHVGHDQVDDLSNSGGEALDAQVMVHKDCADARAGQQVVHVVVGSRQIGYLVLQLGIDCGQFFVD